ncbi:MAG: hypothetical protein NVS2B16_08970 [Chloroflexota bacterium]
MNRCAPVMFLVTMAVVYPGRSTPSTDAAVRSCAVITSVRANLTDLQGVVSAIPRLSMKQAKQRTDRIKFREVSLELGNTKRIVPKDVDDSIARVVSSIRHAVDLHVRNQKDQYRGMLPMVRSQMRVAWDRFHHFQGKKHC